jgi:PAS domain S-box-containing protein
MALLPAGLPLLRWLVLRPLEAEGRRAEARSRADLEALLDAINESALLISPEGQVLAINGTGAQRLKQTPQAMVGRPLWDFLPPEVAESRKLKLAEVTRSGQPLQFEDTLDGRDYLIRMQPIVDGGGVRLVAVYARDITEAHRRLAMERLLREMDEQLLAGRCPEALLEFFCGAVARTLRLALVAVRRREQEGTLRLMAANGPAARLREALGQSPGEESPAARAVELGEAQLLYLDDAAPAPWCEAARQEGGRRLQPADRGTGQNLGGLVRLWEGARSLRRCGAFAPAAEGGDPSGGGARGRLRAGAIASSADGACHGGQCHFHYRPGGPH